MAPSLSPPHEADVLTRVDDHEAQQQPAEEHERRIAALARQVGFEHVVASHEVCALPRFVDRGDTAVTDAATHPILRRYVDHLTAALPGVLAYRANGAGLVPGAVVAGGDSASVGALSAFYHDSTDITDEKQRMIASMRMIATPVRSSPARMAR